MTTTRDPLGRIRRLLAAGLTVYLVQAGPASAQEPLAGSVYRHWLSQDAAYIISDEERETFVELQTDDERKLFVEQFWERRDPTPGTPENEAKEEHYRRIAFANHRFGSTFEGRAPGWLTDRGRIYIQLGPPDEIEARAAGGRSAGAEFESNDPFEVWRYRAVSDANGATITFVDRGAAGHFRLVRQVAGL